MAHTDYSPVQAKIIGYLISVGGNTVSGSTASEIMAGTGYGQDAVYSNLKKGIDGVLVCAAGFSKSKMYYVTKESMANIETRKVKINNGRDAMPDVIIESVSELFKPEPMSDIEKMLTMEPVPEPEPRPIMSMPLNLVEPEPNEHFTMNIIGLNAPAYRAQKRYADKCKETGEPYDVRVHDSVGQNVMYEMCKNAVIANLRLRIMGTNNNDFLLTNAEVAALRFWKEANPDA